MPVPYEIKDDPLYPQGGVAAVLVPDAAGSAAGVVEVLIGQDDPERPFLGPAGWQPTEYRWRSGPVRAEGSSLVIPLGERITAQIEDYTPLLISLPLLERSGRVVWADITPPSSLGQLVSNSGASAGPSFINEWAIPEQPSLPEPEPQPVPGPPPPPKPEPLPPAPEPPPIVLPDGAVPPKPRKRWPWIVAPLVVAVIAALWALAEYEKTLPSYRHKRAVALLASGGPDDAWSLLTPLESEGYGPTLLYLAQAIDSVDFTPGLYSQPNDLAAIQLYTRACAAGAKEEKQDALAALGRLETVLRTRADEGDARADQYLRMQLPKAQTTCR